MGIIKNLGTRKKLRERLLEIEKELEKSDYTINYKKNYLNIRISQTSMQNYIEKSR